MQRNSSFTGFRRTSPPASPSVREDSALLYSNGSLLPMLANKAESIAVFSDGVTVGEVDSGASRLQRGVLRLSASPQPASRRRGASASRSTPPTLSSLYKEAACKPRKNASDMQLKKALSRLEPISGVFAAASPALRLVQKKGGVLADSAPLGVSALFVDTNVKPANVTFFQRA